ncbi:carboxymuconolactone decarboxylase family protein [Phenylobacterium sp.]|uniref:carboxymuconolactone decarboxylase family protein n=1 Tax=Phenylobacterium sp. TaxID=1871053 RepID=UPI0035AE2C9A
MASPKLADLAQELGAFLRYSTSLEPRFSELVILVTASHWKSGYEWAHHVPLARAAGVPEPVIAAIGSESPIDLADPTMAAVLNASRTLLQTGALDDASFEGLREALGDCGVVEVVGLLGYYSMLAMLMNTYETPVDAPD